MDKDEFLTGHTPTDLIIMEEMDEITRPSPVDREGTQGIEVDEESEDLFFLDSRDVTKQVAFTPKSQESANGTDKLDLPIHGKGKLDTFLVVSSSRDFSVNVTVDNSEVVDDDFDTLSTFQSDLTHVSAYQSSENFIVSVSGYPFKEFLDIRIIPTEETVFDIVRVEAIIE